MTSSDKTAVWRHRLILLALWIVFYASYTLFAPPLLDDADSVHAEVAREMLLRHDYVTLYANGIRYLEKAPLFYWAMALCMKLLGATAAAARIPLALSVLALTLLLEAFARRAFSSTRAGLYAGLITLSSFGIFIFSRINIPDVLVCVLLTAALYAFWLAEQHERPPRTLAWLFAALCALDILTKGLIGIVFPLAIVGAYLLLTRGWRGTFSRLRLYSPLTSTLVFLIIAVPWHVLAGLANPAQGHPGAVTFTGGHWQVPLPTDGNVHGWTWFYFINEQVLRYLNLRVPRDYDTVPLWLFLGLIFIWLMPWSAFLPQAISRALPLRNKPWRTRLNTRTLTPAEHTQLLLVIWLGLPLAFFSLSTRQEYYVLPALPPMILLIAHFLASRAPTKPLAQAHRAAVRTPAAILALLGLLAASTCVFFLLHSGTPAPGTDLASLLKQNPADYALSFGHFLDLNAAALGLFRMPLALTALSFGMLLPFAYLLRLGGVTTGKPTTYVHAANLLTAAAAFLFLAAAHQGLVIFSPTLTSWQLAESIRPILHPGDLLVLHGEYEAGSTLGFYLRRTDLHILEGRSSNLWYGSFFPDAPRIFETRASLAARWRGPQRIFVWQDPSDTERPVLTAAELGGPIFIIASNGGKQILSNQPLAAASLK